MSKNCLVTKFKGAVNKDNLPILNSIRLWMPLRETYSGQYFMSVNVKDMAKPVHASWDSAINLYVNSSPVTSPQDMPIDGIDTFQFTCSVEDSIITIEGTDRIKYIQIPYVHKLVKEEIAQLSDLEGLNVSTSSIDLKGNPIVFDIDWVNRALANNKSNISLKVRGDLSVLDADFFNREGASNSRWVFISGSPRDKLLTGDITRFSTIQCSRFQCNDTAVTGDIKNLKLSSNCTFVYFYRTNMTGDIVEFVPAMIAQNLTSGINLGFFNSSDAYTFNGKHPSIGAPTLYWDNGSKIFIKGSGNVIYCYGYTDTEINERKNTDALWTGTTVYKVD